MASASLYICFFVFFHSVAFCFVFPQSYECTRSFHHDIKTLSALFVYKSQRWRSFIIGSPISQHIPAGCLAALDLINYQTTSALESAQCRCTVGADNLIASKLKTSVLFLLFNSNSPVASNIFQQKLETPRLISACMSLQHYPCRAHPTGRQ
jgi:hypothetical protein